MRCIVVFYENGVGDGDIVEVRERVDGDMFPVISGLTLNAQALNTRYCAIIKHLHENVMSSPLSNYDMLEVYSHRNPSHVGIIGKKRGCQPVGLGIFTVAL